jgi:hypothetical protein
MEIRRSGSQPSGKGSAEYFTGTVRIDPLFEVKDPARALGANVTFEPGTRTAWHTHPLSGFVGRPEIGELGEQIVVGAYPVLRHLPICEDSQEVILDVVGERPAIFREGRGARGVKGHEVRQQCPCHASCFLRGIPTRVLQRVREDGDETGIVRRRCGAVRAYLLADKEDSLRRPSAPVRLDPAPTPAVQRASPKANLFRPQGRVGHLQHDAAHVFVSEEIVGIFGADPCHRVAPEPRCLEHIRLVDAADLPAPLARRLERDMRDANDLRLAVAHGVEALALAREGAVWRLAEASRLAEIDVAVELAYDQDVKPAHFLRLQWGRTDELVIQDRRAQIRE